MIFWERGLGLSAAFLLHRTFCSLYLCHLVLVMLAGYMETGVSSRCMGKYKIPGSCVHQVALNVKVWVGEWQDTGIYPRRLGQELWDAAPTVHEIYVQTSFSSPLKEKIEHFQN